jgi:hypothetical protein
MAERNIAFIALSEERIDGMQQIEGIYELSKSDRHNFKIWFGQVRNDHSDFLIMTTEDYRSSDVIKSVHVHLGCGRGETLVHARDVKRLNCRETSS